VKEAHTAWLQFRQWDSAAIITLLHSIADALDSAKGDLVPVAMEETNLPEARLVGEVGRTTSQLRLMAQAVADPTYLDITIDHADSSLTPPRPDLRLRTISLGVVGVFGASNFPFAFGVAGGDTAAALAAGCAVVIKVNPGHPRVSRMVGEIMIAAALKSGAPEGLISLIEDFDAGIDLVEHPLTSAIAFTGSTHGGRALFDAVNRRPHPIPFYGELGGLNPIFVTRSMGSEKAKETAEGFLASITMGAGQFCTKPGFLIVDNAAEITAELSSLIANLPAQKLLNSSIVATHDKNRDAISQVTGMRLVGRNSDGGDTHLSVYSISGKDFLAAGEDARREVFGPTAVVVDCSDADEMIEIAESFSGTLASGIHAIEGDPMDLAQLVFVLEQISGRIVWNQWPTGLAVTWAMQHGGPYPASTNPLFTSVGAKAILRFRRPITYQNFPQRYLSPVLRDGAPELDRARINGKQ
ncbi:MAG: aldehyde dehydrogenase family protein, partial [Candidatus Planktophila sp.]